MARRKRQAASSEMPADYYEPIETTFVGEDEPTQVAQVSSRAKSRRMRPALTPEARENQLISLAVDLAEQQLRDGTASSQVITHYLKLGSTKEKLEREKLEEENKLLRAKTEAMKSAKKVEELYDAAIRAMRTYSGHGEPDEIDEY